jgi:hypothetical protein
MNNWTETEAAFRCQRLSVRLERLAQTCLQLGKSIEVEVNHELALAILRKCKVFLELTAIDLDIDSAYELAQIQRQLSRWHLSWQATWECAATRQEISTLAVVWANRIREMVGTLV